jgi:hypothetical protein
MAGPRLDGLRGAVGPHQRALLMEQAQDLDVKQQCDEEHA